MMLLQIRVIPGGLAVESKLPDQPGLYQRVQGVVHRCPRGPGMPLVERRPEFLHRRVVRSGEKMLQNEKALRRASDTRVFERFFNLPGCSGF